MSPLLFIIVLRTLSLVIRETDYGYRFNKTSTRVKRLLFMDDLKLYGRTQREINSLVHTIRIVSEDNGMKFALDKCKKEKKTC